MTKIKICGLSRPCDIDYVNAARPDYCGFIVNVPKSRRNITEEKLRDLVRSLSKEIVPVGVFVNEDVNTIARLLNDGIIDIAQLHGGEDNGYIKKLRELTKFPLIQAFKVKSNEDTARAEASAADYILLDSGSGSGKVFDWRLIKGVNRPYFLAGGLSCDNIDAALRELHPYAVDISSGVESNGYKDEEKIKAAVAAVRRFSE